MKMYKFSTWNLKLEEKEVEKIADKYIFYKGYSKNKLERQMIESSLGTWYKTKKEAIESKLILLEKNLIYKKEEIDDLEKNIIELNEMMKRDGE